MKTAIATVLMTLGVCLATSGAQADTLYDSTGGSIFSGAIFDGTILFGGGFLLDNGSLPNGSGRTVSGANIAGGWTVFQPFEVTGPGWNVTTIGVDGWRVLDPMGLGMLGTLLPDADGDPDEGNPIASNTFFLGTDAFNANWRDESFDVTLTPGMYWMKWEDNGDPGFWSAIFNAPQGLNSFSRRDDGGIFGSGPTALRIAGEEIPAPGAFGLLAIGLGMARRRRRTV
jgi:MYXO-CTERM domain-containing protein